MRLALISALLILSPSVAFAGTSDDIKTCKTAITEAMAEDAEATTITFSKISGASLKKITFTVVQGERETTAVCKIKRGRVISVDR